MEWADGAGFLLSEAESVTVFFCFFLHSCTFSDNKLHICNERFDYDKRPFSATLGKSGRERENDYGDTQLLEEKRRFLLVLA